MFGKKLSDYVRFESWILVLIVAAFLIRLGLSLNGSSFTQIRWVSINIVLLLGLIYCAIAVHIRRLEHTNSCWDFFSCRMFSRIV